MAAVERNLCKALMFLLCAGFANGLIVAPSNAAVVDGSWMSMECRPTKESHVFRWTLMRPNSSKVEDIFRNHNGRRGLTYNYSSYFGVDMDESCSGLLYSNATRSTYAGVYGCRTMLGRRETVFTSYLTVLESEPLCETNYTAEDNATLKEGEVIWMQCSVNFRGMWSPTIEWKQHTEGDKQEDDDRQMILSRGVSTETISNSRITSTLIYVSGSNKTISFSCRIFFQGHNGSVRVTATNVPSYTYTWESPRLERPHREQLKTTEPEEPHIAPLPVEVGPFGTTTPKSNGSNDWYIISLILLFAVLVFVSLLIGMGIRRYVRFRTVRDLNMIYNASTSSATPLRRLELPPPIDYDIVPTAQSNVYDWIDGAGAGDDIADQETTSQSNCRPLLKECYSGLMVAMGSDVCQYDTLDLYEKMDQFNPETEDTATGKTSERPSQKPEEERYTTPGSKMGVVTVNHPSGSSDYLQMIESAKHRKTGVKPLCVAVPNDSGEYDNPDGKTTSFAKDKDDYLLPSPIAMGNFPTCMFADHVIEK